ncbi:MAG: hypothetical protein FJ123_04190 [Deltaproteobacteria bacterium]|nr:hypothetical protein [Deltaproteobacteria bacterium]
MRTYYENKTPGYFDLKYIRYLPIDLKRYGIPATTKKPQKPFYENKLVGHILETIYRKDEVKSPLGESIDELFKDRLGLIRSKIELILLQLEQRKKINQEILYRIDQDSCKAQSLIFEMGYRVYRMDRDRLTLEKTKFDLEGQKRLEEVSYFRDTGLLNKDLKDTLIQYLGEVQKGKIIGLEEEP